MTKPGPKGKRGERKAVKLLSNWSGVKLIRVYGSGGLAGESADITTDNRLEYFPLSVEVKNNESWTFEKILQDKGSFLKWWEQTLRQTEEKSNRTQKFYYPFLMFTRNYVPWYIAINQILCRDVSYIPKSGNMIQLFYDVYGLIYIISWDDFSRLVDYTDVLYNARTR